MLVMVAITGTLLLPSCKDKQDDKDGLVGSKRPADREIAYDLAMKCVEEYEKTPLDRIKKKTTSVTFRRDSLENWLKHLNSITMYDKMQLRFGIYTQDVLNDTPEEDNHNVDKITVFLFPMLKCEPARRNKLNQDQNVDPFNMGEVYP